jgi:hypothetical protein
MGVRQGTTGFARGAPHDSTILVGLHIYFCTFIIPYITVASTENHLWIIAIHLCCTTWKVPYDGF